MTQTNITTLATVTSTDTFVNTSNYEDYLRSLCEEEVDTMAGAKLNMEKIIRAERWLAKIEEQLLATDADKDYAGYCKLLNLKDFVEFELKVLTDEVGGPINRWWNRLHLSGVEYGGIEDGDALDAGFLQTDAEDGGATPIFEAQEQDGQWWEEQYSQPSGLLFKDDDGNQKFALNWDHLNKVSEVRDGLAAQLLWEVDKATSIRDLVRITKWAGLWSWHAQERNSCKKGSVSKANTFGIDFARYAEICNAAAARGCEMKRFPKGAAIIRERLSYSTKEEKDALNISLGKFRPWLAAKVSNALKVFGIQSYENPTEENESEDLLDRGAAQGEFCADAEFALLNKVTVELAMEQTVELFEEARRRMTSAPVTSFHLSDEEISDWMSGAIRPVVATPRLTVTLGELFNL